METPPCAVRRRSLCDRSGAVHVPGTRQRVIEDIEKAAEDQPVGGRIVGHVGDPPLQSGQHAAAHDHRHEDARGHRGVFAEPLDRQIEDRAPHDRRAEPAQHETHQTDRHGFHAERKGCSAPENRHPDTRFGRKVHPQHNEHQPQRRRRREHRAARDAPAEQPARKPSDKHQKPVGPHDRPRHGGVHVERPGSRTGHVEIGDTRNPDLDAHIDEDGRHAQPEMTERQGTGPLAPPRLVHHEGLGNPGPEKHQKREGENAHGQKKDRIGSRDDAAADRVAHQVAAQNGSQRAPDGVADAAELDQLVAPSAASPERIEHRIDHRVEHAHRESRDESPRQIEGEAPLAAAREQRHPDAGESDDHGRQGGAPVPVTPEHRAGGDSHAGIGEEVGEGAPLRAEGVQRELLFDDHSQGALQVGDECDHKKEREHHHNRQGIVFLRFHRAM